MKPGNLLLITFTLLTLWACSGPTATIPDTASMRAEMETDVEFLASDELEGRETGQPGAYRAADYIVERMQEIGLKPMGDNGTWFQSFSVGGANNPHEVDFTEASDSSINARNVIGYLDHGAQQTVVIGAHYDHLGYGDDFGSLHTGEREIHNGADDNASGVAAMLQLARILKTQHTQHNYLFIAFTGEEKGLWGSNYFSKNPTIDLDQVNYMLNLDMVGRLNEERKLSVNAVGTAPQWVPALEAISVDSIEIVTTEGGIGGSDHTSFYLQEVPALHFFTGQHEHYHKPSDDAHLVNYDGMVSVVKFIAALIGELEDDGTLVWQETDQPDRMARDFKVTLGVMPDYLYTDEGMRIDGVRDGRPAANGGLEKGDIVLKMGDVEVKDMQGYMEALNQFQPGQQITVVIKRGDAVIEKQITFANSEG